MRNAQSKIITHPLYKTKSIKNPSQIFNQKTTTPFTKLPLQFRKTKNRNTSLEQKMSASGVLFSLFLLLFFYFFSLNEVRFAQVEANGVVGKNGTAAAVAEMVPMIGAERVLMVNESRRKLGSFQICALCTCCGGAKGYCLPTPCCYAINCNIPNRPFGFCSFTPKTCNCFGCHL